MWEELKAADAALGIEDPTAAVAELIKETIPAPAQIVSVASVHGVLLMSLTADWQRILLVAKQDFSDTFLTAPTGHDMIIAAAKNAVTLAESQVKQIDPDKWAGFMMSIEALAGIGVISPDSEVQIKALSHPLVTTPRWPGLNVGTLQLARSSE